MTPSERATTGMTADLDGLRELERRVGLYLDDLTFGRDSSRSYADMRHHFVFGINRQPVEPETKRLREAHSTWHPGCSGGCEIMRFLAAQPAAPETERCTCRPLFSGHVVEHPDCPRGRAEAAQPAAPETERLDPDMDYERRDAMLDVVRLAQPAAPETEHALHFDPDCEECAYLARPTRETLPAQPAAPETHEDRTGWPDLSMSEATAAPETERLREALAELVEAHDEFVEHGGQVRLERQDAAWRRARAAIEAGDGS